MEVVEAVTAAVGAERTGVRISPQSTQGVCVPLGGLTDNLEGLAVRERAP